MGGEFSERSVRSSCRDSHCTFKMVMEMQLIDRIGSGRQSTRVDEAEISQFGAETSWIQSSRPSLSVSLSRYRNDQILEHVGFHYEHYIDQLISVVNIALQDAVSSVYETLQSRYPEECESMMYRLETAYHHQVDRLFKNAARYIQQKIFSVANQPFVLPKYRELQSVSDEEYMKMMNRVKSSQQRYVS